MSYAIQSPNELSLGTRSSARGDQLRVRAEVYRKIREFFYRRDVLEVETPLLYPTALSHPEIRLFSCEYESEAQETSWEDGQQNKVLYLQTSPEAPMKRILADGVGSIFQICKAFRNGESGRLHNPEFTILEWYRIGFDLEELMAEVGDLVRLVIGKSPVERVSYREAFLRHVGFDPFEISLEELHGYILRRFPGLKIESSSLSDHDALLELVMDQIIERELGNGGLTYVHSYPPGQASLARITKDPDRIARRFEVFASGIEIANGYEEINDPEELKARLDDDNDYRKARGLSEMPLDERLIESLDSLPTCSGVAVGLDRLLMLATSASSIEDIIAFPMSSI